MAFSALSWWQTAKTPASVPLSPPFFSPWTSFPSLPTHSLLRNYQLMIPALLWGKMEGNYCLNVHHVVGALLMFSYFLSQPCRAGMISSCLAGGRLRHCRVEGQAHSHRAKEPYSWGSISQEHRLPLGREKGGSSAPTSLKFRWIYPRPCEPLGHFLFLSTSIHPGFTTYLK